MKTELTPEEEAHIDVVCKRYEVPLDSLKTNDQAIEDYAEEMYKYVELPRPCVVILDSPEAVQHAIDVMDEKTKPEEDDPKVFEALKAECIEEANRRVREGLVPKKFTSSVRDYPSDIAWVAFYRFFTEIGVDRDPEFDRYADFIEKGAPYWVSCFDGCMFVSRMPVEVNLWTDDAGNISLHSMRIVEGVEDSLGHLIETPAPSARFADGFSCYHWKGVDVDKRLILNPETWTREDILATDNAELRRCYQERLGSDVFGELLGLEELDKTDYNGKPYILTRTKEKESIINEHLYFVHVECPSTERKYLIPVDPANCKLKDGSWSAWSAVSSTFPIGIQGVAYAPDVET